MNSTLEFTIGLVRSAAEILAGHYSPFGTAVNLKPDRSVVTQADLDADQHLRAALLSSFPGEMLLSEEGMHSLPGVDAPVWIIDPLDGTTNFALGLPIWGILVARIVGGYPDTAVSYFPMMNELYTAQKGEGAFFNGEPFKIPPHQEDHAWSFFSCCSRTFRRYHIEVPYKTRILGSGGYTLCSVARGAAILGFEATPMIWDLASGWLILQEAGGYIEPFSGPDPFPVQPDFDYTGVVFPTIAASTPEIITKSRKKITSNNL